MKLSVNRLQQGSSSTNSPNKTFPLNSTTSAQVLNASQLTPPPALAANRNYNNMSTNYHQSLPQPYAGLNQDRDLSRLSADIPYADKELIKSVCPKKGVLMQMTQVFFHTIVTEMKRLNLTHYTPENENEFIAIIVGITQYQHRGLAAPELTRDTPPRNVRAGTKGTHTKTTRGVKQRGNTKAADKQTDNRKTVN